MTTVSTLVSSLLYKVLDELSHRKESTLSSLTSDVCLQLISGDHDRGDDQCVATSGGLQVEQDHVTSGPLQILTGYPQHSLCKRLSLSISNWMETGCSPVSDLPDMYMLNEEPKLESRNERTKEVSALLSGKAAVWDNWSPEERESLIQKTLTTLELRGVLDLLGVRHTVGSVDTLPPSREQLMAAFNTLHRPVSKLTVGARALSKHHHRDESASWWGNSTGSEEKKNQHAVTVVERILDNCTWINIHTLPHDIKVVEMRTLEGYGARWQLLSDGTCSQFRGFLEPQMMDGHSVHWKH